jgi:RNA ligase.
MKQFPKLKYPSHPSTDGLSEGKIMVTEKIDGANFRFTWNEDHDLIIGTRNHEYHEDSEDLPKAFEHAVEFIQDEAGYEPFYRDYTFFGEANHLHTIEYEGVEYEVPHSGPAHFGEGYPNVVIFDAYHDQDGWLDWHRVTAAAKVLDIPVVDVVEEGTIDEIDAEIPSESMFGGPPEGVVLRRWDGAVRAKKVSEDFKESHRGGGGASSQTFSDEEADAREFVWTYITRARIEKQAHKLVDEVSTSIYRCR